MCRLDALRQRCGRQSFGVYLVVGARVSGAEAGGGGGGAAARRGKILQGTSPTQNTVYGPYSYPLGHRGIGAYGGWNRKMLCNRAVS